mmetsp:Transcript_17931/g.19961  ORF Transcript_17931/g.19961 Transcript_17931/m.19961 type:complete len:643 (+) Transcript_17931:3-1931(+)
MDCTARSCTYICTTFNTVLCTLCSGVMREIPYAPTSSIRVKSIHHTTFTDAEVDAICEGGNEVAIAKWRASWTPQSFPKPGPDDRAKIKEFILKTYVEKQWVATVKKKKKRTKKKRKSKKIKTPTPEPLSNLLGNNIPEIQLVDKARSSTAAPTAIQASNTFGDPFGAPVTAPAAAQQQQGGWDPFGAAPGQGGFAAFNQPPAAAQAAPAATPSLLDGFDMRAPAATPQTNGAQQQAFGQFGQTPAQPQQGNSQAALFGAFGGPAVAQSPLKPSTNPLDVFSKSGNTLLPASGTPAMTPQQNQVTTASTMQPNQASGFGAFSQQTATPQAQNQFAQFGGSTQNVNANTGIQRQGSNTSVGLHSSNGSMGLPTQNGGGMPMQNQGFAGFINSQFGMQNGNQNMARGNPNGMQQNQGFTQNQNQMFGGVQSQNTQGFSNQFGQQGTNMQRQNSMPQPQMNQGFAGNQQQFRHANSTPAMNAQMQNQQQFAGANQFGQNPNVSRNVNMQAQGNQGFAGNQFVQQNNGQNFNGQQRQQGFQQFGGQQQQFGAQGGQQFYNQQQQRQQQQFNGAQNQQFNGQANGNFNGQQMYGQQQMQNGNANGYNQQQMAPNGGATLTPGNTVQKPSGPDPFSSLSMNNLFSGKV